MLYLPCQKCYLPLSVSGGNNKKIAFIKGGARKRPPRCVASPDNPTIKAFYFSNMLHKSDGSAFGRATMELIHTTSELERNFVRAEELTEDTKEKWVAQDIQSLHHDTTIRLGLALWRRLNDFFSDETDTNKEEKL